jgi:hypothetical protein
MRPAHPSLFVAVAFLVWAAASSSGRADFSTVGQGPHSPYGLTLHYTAQSATNATLIVTLTNTIASPKGGLLDAFVFNNPDGDVTTASLTDPHFQLIGGPSFSDGINAAPYGHFDIGASTFGAFEGGSPKNGISPGHTGVFTFHLTGHALNALNEESFVGALSEPPGAGRGDQFFVARFHAFVGDAGFGDKVPAVRHMPEPAALTLGALGVLGCLGGAWRLRRRTG